METSRGEERWNNMARAKGYPDFRSMLEDRSSDEESTVDSVAKELEVSKESLWYWLKKYHINMKASSFDGVRENFGSEVVAKRQAWMMICELIGGFYGIKFLSVDDCIRYLKREVGLERSGIVSTFEYYALKLDSSIFINAPRMFKRGVISTRTINKSLNKGLGY